MTALGASAWYVYAILHADAAAPAGCETILPGAPVTLVAGDRTAGAAGLAALVSLVPRMLFAPDDPASRAAEPDWVAECAAAHHAVVSRVHAAGACLPLGFGTLFASTAGVRAWLCDNDAAFRRALGQVAGRREWGVALCEDGDAHAAWLRAHNTTVAALTVAAAGAGPGAGFLLARRVERAVALARTEHAAQVAAAVGDRLADCGPVLAEPASRGDAAAWSVLMSSGDGLAGLLAELDCTVAPTGLALRATGPFPPYAFARAAWQAGLHG